MFHAGRAHGIVKRFFGKSANYGKDLNCPADIIKEIPRMEKVTPAMLLSAQSCVSKNMEETWFAKYLATFQVIFSRKGEGLLVPVRGH